MVWDQFEEQKSKPLNFWERLNGSQLLAVPVDRLGAFVVDIVISYFVSSLASSPLQKEMAEAQILGNSGLMVFLGISIGLSHLFIAYIYFSASMHFRGRTLGQQAFRIKVVDILTGKKLSLIKTLKRNAFFILELPFILPFLAIFTDPFRRAMHEKISDSVCVSSSDRFSLSPSPQEKSFIRGLLIPAYLWLFALGLSMVSAGSNYLLEDNNWLSRLNDSIPRCDAVVEKLDSETNSFHPTEENPRLMLALSLYSSGQISQDCLLAEADAAFLSRKNLDYAYLAKSFALDGVPELSDDYLLESCKEGLGSEACLFSKLLRSWRDKDWEKANKILSSLESSNKSFIKNFTIEHFMKRKRYQEAYEMIVEQSKNPVLVDFLSKYRNRALWYLGKEREAEAVFLSSRTSLDRTVAQTEGAWLCWKSLQRSCDNVQSPICRDYSYEEFAGSPKEDVEYLAVMRNLECSEDPKKDLKLESMFSDLPASLKAFARANALNDFESMKNILADGVFENVSPELRFEIVNRLANSANSSRELDKLNSWVINANEFEPEWEAAILSIQSNYYRLGVPSRAERIAERSLKILNEMPSFKRRLVVNAFNKSSSSWVKSFAKGILNSNSRAPASVGTQIDKSTYIQYNEILKELEK